MKNKPNLKLVHSCDENHISMMKKIDEEIKRYENLKKPVFAMTEIKRVISDEFGYFIMGVGIVLFPLFIFLLHQLFINNQGL